MRRHYVKLTDEQIVLLDGAGDAETQANVDRAKRRLAMREDMPDAPAHIASLAADVVTEAVSAGRLIFRHRQIRSCDWCDAWAGYAKRTRNSKYHRKGESDSSRPLHLNGVELAHRFVSVEGSSNVGCCSACWDQLKPLLPTLLSDVRAEIPEAITGQPPRFKWNENRKCGQCGWEGHAGQMGMKPSMMGGPYPAVCPQCSAENLPIVGGPIDRADGFTITDAEAAS